MDIGSLKDYVDVSKGALDLLKAAYSLLPTSSAQREEIAGKLKSAEEIMRRADAKLAKELGYQLCRCTFPPTPMLWRERERAYVCQRAECGHRIAEYRSSDEDESTYF
jgi:hypothetical protein